MAYGLTTVSPLAFVLQVLAHTSAEILEALGDGKVPL